jgi:hypothetical protein
MNRAPFLTNLYGGTRMDGTRRHDLNWSDVCPSDRGDFSAITGIVNAALLGAAMWAALGVFVLILWGVMA